MLRRLAFLIAGAAIVVGACSSGTPAAPALTDPKEILTKSVTTPEGRQVLPPEGRRRRRGQDRSDRPGERRWRPQPAGHDRRGRRRHRQQEGQDRVRGAGAVRRHGRDDPDRQRHLYQGQPPRRQVHQDDLGGGRSRRPRPATHRRSIQELSGLPQQAGRRADQAPRREVRRQGLLPRAVDPHGRRARRRQRRTSGRERRARGQRHD